MKKFQQMCEEILGTKVKKVKLTPKDIQRADKSSGKSIAIISRPQHDGRFWVAAVDTDTSNVLWDEYADDKAGVAIAVQHVNSWLGRMGMGGKTADASRERSASEKDTMYTKGMRKNSKSTMTQNQNQSRL